MSRDYQYDFSINSPSGNRERKALTLAAALPDNLSEHLAHYDLLNVGGSAR